MKSNGKEIIRYFAIFVLILLLSEFVQISNTSSISYGVTRNTLSQFQTAIESNNAVMGIENKVNLTIREIGIDNGSAWDAIINGVHYQTHSLVLNLSIQSGDYLVSFYSRGAYGSSQNVNLTLGSKKIVEYFYRMENLSREYSGIGPIRAAVTINNTTAILGRCLAETINTENGTFQNYIISPYLTNTKPEFLGRSGSNYIVGVVCPNSFDNQFKISSYNPNTQSTKLILDSCSLIKGQPFCNIQWPFTLSAMSVWHNEAFVSFRNTQTNINSIYGLVYLKNSTFINLTGDFPGTTSKNISVCAGNGNYLIGLNNSWFLLNGTTMNISYERAIGDTISQSQQIGLYNENSVYMGFNGSAFIIGNYTRIIAFNPSNGSTSSIFMPNDGIIWAMYANSSVILAGIQEGKNFSMIDIEKGNGMQPLFTETNASESVYGYITAIHPYGNIMFLAGSSPNSIYLFTDSNYSGITFIECGLSKGTPWTINLNGKTTTVTAVNIDFKNLSTGCYAYSVGSNSSFNVTSGYSRIYYEKGQIAEVSFHFNARFTFSTDNITSFNASNSLSVQLTNNLGEQINSISKEQFDNWYCLPSGNYSFCAIMKNSYTRGVRGNINVGNASNVKQLSFITSSFSTVFNIIDKSSVNTQWSMDLRSYYTSNGAAFCWAENFHGTGSLKKTLNLADNLYSYNLYSNSNNGQQSFYKYGSIVINGSLQIVNITLVNYYPVNISEAGIPAYNGIPYQYSLKYHWGFAIYSNISGKPELRRMDYYMMSPSVSVCLPDGSYYITTMTGPYYLTNGTLYFNISGKAENIVLDLSPLYYSVLLDEKGISPEYKWYVNSSSGNYSAFGGTAIKLNAINGLNCFTVTTNDPTMVAETYCHVIFVNGINKTLTVRFSKGYYVNVKEAGLPANTRWYFGIPGEMEKNTTNTSMSIVFPAGNFTFCANSENHTYSTYEMASHAITVNRNETVDISFAEYMENLSLYFYGGGNSSDGFSVVLSREGSNSTYYGNSTYNGQNYFTSFFVINGTYRYKAKDNNSVFETAYGTVNVTGSIFKIINFAVFTFNVVFKEYGIGKATNWGVHISRGSNAGKSYYSLGFSTLKITMLNGTYSLSAFAGIPGYGTEMTNYSVKINSTTTFFNVTFYQLYTPSDSSSGLLFGSLPAQFYSGFLAIIGICAGTTLMFLIRKRAGNLR